MDKFKEKTFATLVIIALGVIFIPMLFESKPSAPKSIHNKTVEKPALVFNEQPNKIEPSKIEPSKGEPSKGEPSKGESSKIEPSKGQTQSHKTRRVEESQPEKHRLSAPTKTAPFPTLRVNIPLMSL